MSRPRGQDVLQQARGAENRRFKTKVPATNLAPAQYALRTDLPNFLWQKDNVVDRCPQCFRQFGFFLRMHHCRACGYVYCDRDCPEDDDHDQDRVCTNCKGALAELNHLTKIQFEEKITNSRLARKKLTELENFVEVDRVRQALMDDENAERLLLKQTMKNALIDMAAKIRTEIVKVVGNVQIEKRRMKPIYGTRSGVLRLRVRRAKNLPSVKPSMNCNPHVIVQVGHDRQCTPPVMTKATCAFETRVDAVEKTLKTNNHNNSLDPNHQNQSEEGQEGVTSNNGNSKKYSRYFLPASHDFMFEELFVFDVPNDREGVIVALVDDITNAPVPILLGMTYINLRKMNLIEEDVDWGLFELFETKPPTLMSSHTSEYIPQQQKRANQPDGPGFLFSAKQKNQNQSEHINVAEAGSLACAGSLLLPNGEKVRGASLGAAYCSLVLPPPLMQAVEVDVAAYQNAKKSSKDKKNNNNSDNNNSSSSTSSVIQKLDSKEMREMTKKRSMEAHAMSSSGQAVMEGKGRKDFEDYFERGNANNVPLYDYLGNALTSAQVSISWTFHPYKLSNREKLLASANSQCRICKRRDIPSPNDCMCADEAKELADEEYVRELMRNFGREVHAHEEIQREKNPKFKIVQKKEKTSCCC